MVRLSILPILGLLGVLGSAYAAAKPTPAPTTMPEVGPTPGQEELLQPLLNEIREEKTSLEQSVTRLQRDLSQAQEETAGVEERIAVLQLNLARAQEARKELQEQITGVERDINRVQDATIRLDERIQDLGQQLAGALRDRANLVDRIRVLTREFTQTQQDKKGLEERVQRLEQKLAEARESTGGFDLIPRLERDLTRARQENADLQNRITALEQSLTQARQDKERLEEKITGLEQNSTRARHDKERLEEKITGLQRDLGQAQEDKKTLDERITGLGRALTQSRSSKTELEGKVSDLQRERTRTLARVSLLGRAISKLQEKSSLEGLPVSVNLGDLEVARRLNSVEGYALTHEHPFAEHAFGGTVMAGTIDGLRGHRNSGEHGKDTNIGGRPSHAGMKGWFVEKAAREFDFFPDAGKHAQVQPRWNSAFHHRYAEEWIHKAFKDGMKIMVAFLHENEVFCELAGPDFNHGARQYTCSGGNSFESLSRQIDIAREWAAKTTWAQIAESADEARDIISQDKLAVMLGVEADYAFGKEGSEFDPVDRLNDYYDMGVRSFYFAHFINSRLGGTSIRPVPDYAVQYIHEDIYLGSRSCPKGEIYDPWIDVGGLPGAICKDRLREVAELSLPMYLVLGSVAFESIANTANNPAATRIENNLMGLTSVGRRVMKEAMEKGMLLDIGHTSDRTQEDMWELSQANYSYPLNAFHAWPRSRMVEEIKSPDLPDAVRLLIRQNLGRGLTIPEQRVPNEWHLSDRALDMIEETGGIYGQRLGVADYVDYPDSGVVSPSNGCGKGTSLEAAQVLAWLLDRGLDVAYALDFHPAEGLKPREVRAGEACGPPSSSFEMRVVDPDPVPGPVDPDSGRAPKAEKAILDEDGYAFYKKGLNHVGRMAGFHFDLADIGLDRRYIDELKNRSAERFLQMWEQSEALAEKLNTEDANNANNEDSL